MSASAAKPETMLHISVIIPTYNRERFVVKALDSVLKQTFSDYEIIVIDDGSTDNTRKALEGYAPSIRYIYQENSGVASARNTGINAARGEWVAFLDSDDEWKEEYLASQMSRVEEVPHAVTHVTNTFTIYPNGKKENLFFETRLLGRFKTEHRLIVERPLSTIVDHAPWFLQSSIIRRDVLLRAGLFDTELSIAEDIDVIARVALRGAFTFYRKELVDIFRREEAIENLSAQSFKKGINRYESFGKVYSNLLHNKGLSAKERITIRRVLSGNLRALGNILVKTGKKIEARQSYKRSFLVYPSIQSLIKYGVTFLHEKISCVLVRKSEHVLPGEDISS